MHNTHFITPRTLLALVLGAVSIGCAAPSIEGTDYSSSKRGRASDRDRNDEDADETRETKSATSMPSTVVKTGAGSSRIRYVEKDGRRMAFGDIVLPTPRSNGKGVATAAGQVNQWPGGVVPYVVSSNDQAAVEAGIAQWAAKTQAVKFVPRTNETDYIDVIKGQGCYSAIGRTGGRQELSIGDGCAYAHVVAHELGHAVGLWHEQSRADRDSFLDVNTANADASMIHNFDKLTFQSIGAFDYASIMLYSSYAFSNNNQPTMLRSDGSEIQDNQDVSANDAAGIEALYSGAPVAPEPAGGGGAQPGPPDPTGGEAGDVGAGQVTVIANLPLREGPSPQYAAVLTIPAGSPVELTGDTAGNYVGVVFDGVAGWAHGAYLE